MASQDYITFRARRDQEASFEIIREWCIANQHPVSAIFNSFIDAIAYSLTHATFYDEESGNFYIRSDFGDVPIINMKRQYKKNWEKLVSNQTASIRLLKGKKPKNK